MNISGARVFITGGAGFIGSNLAERLLEKGCEVTIFDSMTKPYGGNMFNLSEFRNKITFYKGDIRSEKVLRKSMDGSDFIFHLAAQTGRSISMENPEFDTEINYIGTINIINNIIKMPRKPKLIFAGSRGVIGEPKHLPVDEQHPENPRDTYGINKLAAEKMVLLYGLEGNFGSTSLRLNNVYGPKCQIRSNHYGTVNLFVSYALQEKGLPVYGTGLQTRDYIYVEDVVSAFILAMDKKSNAKFFFVGTGKPTSLLEIVKIIKKNIPSTSYKKVKFPKDLKSIDFPDFYSSSNLIEKTLGWKPKIQIEEGIRRTVDFYRKNLNQYL